MSSSSSSTFTLTRFLYPLDEIELSFINSLLNKTNLQECYFWIFEIHFSGFDVFPFLLKVYLDFYKELNPNLENYIIKKNPLNALVSSDIVLSLASIVRNLFRANPSPNAFLLRLAPELFTCFKPKKSYSSSKNVFVSPTEEDIKTIMDTELLPISPIYNTLKFKRLFSTSDKIGCFDLKRYSIIDTLKNAYQYNDFLYDNFFHWEYYAMRSPLWYSRLTSLNGSIDHVKKEIVFLDDDAKEQFYELYGYEFDEQTKSILDMSHKDYF
jgi:hypothetical protein